MRCYRPDVDGLRAVCIVSVIMFHAGFGDWSGGFIGVDVFFVISGFLITSLIWSEISEDRFSILGFYERRVRRLLAATIPVLVCTTLFAAAFYTSTNFVTYCKSLIAFVTYTSNWFFLSEADYFGTSPEVSPLLHTWSLAVEEQFYLVFPFLLLALRRAPRAAPGILAALAVASLLYAQYELSQGHTDRAFYSSLSRFWQLLFGAVLALTIAKASTAHSISLPMRVVGLGMIVAPVFVYDSSTPMPGLAALVPVLGGVLVIAASPDRSDPIWKALTAPPVVYIGRISYSLYLWHWPIFGAMRTLVLDHNDAHKVLAIALSVGCAALSYHYMEQPLRTRRKLPRYRDMALLLAASSASVVAFAGAGWHAGGWPARFAPGVEARAALAAARPADFEACIERGSQVMPAHEFCKFNVRSPGGIDLLLWGDSHANAILPAFRRYAQARDLSFAAAARGDCLPLLGIWRTKDVTQACRRFNDRVMQFIRDNNIHSIVLAARWSAYTAGNQWLHDDLHEESSRSLTRTIFETAFGRTLRTLEDRSVAIFEQAPEHGADLPAAYLVLTRLGHSIDAAAADRQKHEKRQRFTTEVLTRLEQAHSVLRIDPAKVLCPQTQCTAEAEGKLLYFDDDHLNLAGNSAVYPLIEVELDGWLEREPVTSSGDPLHTGTSR